MKCLKCKHWDIASENWGYCKLITVDSEYLGVNLQSFIDGLDGIENEIKSFLETNKNFYCKLFEEK